MIARNVNGEVHYYNDKGTRRLLSPSRLLAIYNGGKFDMIPKRYLEPAIEYGVGLGLELANFFGGKDFDKKYQEPITNLLNIIQSYNPKTINFESHYGSEIFHGFIDIELDKCIIELKTRSTFKLELETIIQCEIYKQITGKPYHIIYVVRKTGEARELIPTKIQKAEARKVINATKKIINILWKTQKERNENAKQSNK